MHSKIITFNFLMPMLTFMEKTENITKNINSLFYGEEYQFKIYFISKKLYSLVTIFEQVSSNKGLSLQTIKYNNLLNYINKQIKLLLQTSNNFSRRLENVNENNPTLRKRQKILQLIVSKILNFFSFLKKYSKIYLINPKYKYTEIIHVPLPKIEKSFFSFQKEEIKSDNIFFSVSLTINEQK